jgi:hypothetical protein
MTPYPHPAHDGGIVMSKKSVVLLAGLGVAAAAAGAWAVRRRSFLADTFPIDAFDSDAVVSGGSVATGPLPAPEWNRADEDALASELVAAVDDEPVNVR